ncbi:MAG: hypothetical protein ACLRI8_00410 [Agathobacter rectalis]
MAKTLSISRSYVSRIERAGLKNYENCSNRCLQKAKICYHRAMSFVHLSMHLPQLE